MNYLKILNSNEKQEIEKKLNEQFGINQISGILIKKRGEKIFLFTGNFNEKQIRKLAELAFLETIGVYFAKEINREFRLSIEGAQILKNQIKKNIFELNKEQAEKWMMGQELNIKTGKTGFIIMEHKGDILGCGKASEEKITNFIPKTRRLKGR